ncbi:MAG TPA: response regulator [Myxococcota bacterium]|nr:response regulator [Myxococcota bacterium]
MNTKPLVLIAENDEDSLWRFSRWITELGCQVVVAASGGELLSRMAPEKPDLVILDLGGSGADGLGFCRLLKSSINFGKVPLVAVAGELDFGMRERARRAGADAVLVKPVSQLEMINQARRLLGMVDDGRLAEKITELEKRVWTRASRASGGG